MIRPHGLPGPVGGKLVRIAALEPTAIAEHRSVPLPMPPYNSLGPIGLAGLGAAGLSDMPRPRGETQSHLFTFERAVIATRCGIVALADGRVLADTLDHRHNDDAVQTDGVSATLPPAQPVAGTWLSLLLGGVGNWYHVALMNLGRLALLGRDEVTRIDGVLVPDGLAPAFATLLERGLDAVWGAYDRPRPRLIAVGPATSLRPERLILPLNVAETGYYLGRSLALLRSLAPRITEPPPMPAAIYIDRGDSTTRRLTNEAAIVQALAGRGITPVRLTGLDLDTQALLFASAQLIVAPHGAGLTNLIFARPGTMVIELMPDRLANWCYRRLSAMLRLRYEAVIGRAEATAPPGEAAWTVPLDQVLAALP